MHKSFFVVEETDVKLSESFSFGVNITKSTLLSLITVEEDVDPFTLPRWNPIIGPVSFNEGLLENVPNTFELRILPNLWGVAVYYPESLKREKKEYGVYVTEMKFSLLADDQKKFHVNMSRYELPGVYYDNVPSPLGSRNFFNLKEQYEPNQWCDDGLCRDDLNLTTWPSSVNELRIDITISQFKKPEFTVSEDVLPAYNVPKGHMDPSKHFLSTELSDVSIRCQGTTFPAHIFILAYHSPVFAKMFEHEMRESKERFIEIENVDPNVLREMLRYFYTGGVENLENNAMELFILADRYLVDQLKPLCIRALVHSDVNMENAAEMYYFGRMKEIPALTAKAKQEF